jgi:hypothetical protein
MGLEAKIGGVVGPWRTRTVCMATVREQFNIDSLEYAGLTFSSGEGEVTSTGDKFSSEFSHSVTSASSGSSRMSPFNI